jgi:hypothetical protein
MFLGVISGMAMAPGSDICKTPVGPVVVPIPYPNILDLSMTEPLPTITMGGTPAVNMQCKGLLSQGDEAGVLGGVISSMIMGTGQFLSGVPNIMIGGAPAIIMGGTATLQNSNNAPGNVTLVGQMIVSGN